MPLAFEEDEVDIGMDYFFSIRPLSSRIEVRVLLKLELEVEVGTVEVHQAFLAVPVAAAASVQHPLQAAPR